MKPVVLCILDGVGIREESYGNAVKLANTPCFVRSSPLSNVSFFSLEKNLLNIPIYLNLMFINLQSYKF